MKTRFAVYLILLFFATPAFPQRAIPDFLLIADTGIDLSQFEIKHTDIFKIELIHALYKSRELKEYYTTYGNKLIDNKLGDYYLIDLNQDGKPEVVFYGWAPICNFQKLIIIAENINNEFKVRWFHEADFVSFSMNSHQTTFQAINSGCCLDKYDYLYTYTVGKGDSVLLNYAADVFWKGERDSACTPQFPIKTDQSDSIIILKDSALLSQSPWDVDPDCISHSLKYYVKKGYRGVILSKKTNKDSSVWFFVKIKFDNNDRNPRKTQIGNIFGWINSNDVEVIEHADSGKCILILDSTSNRQVYILVDMLPEFPGGNDAMLTFISENIKIPKEADVQGTVYVSVIVEPTGQLSNIRIMRGIGGGCDEAALKVLDMMPNWVPGLCHGTAVPVSMVVPIKYRISW